jgi:hypothetical protein
MDLENKFSSSKQILTNLLDVGDSYKKFVGIVAKQFSLSNYADTLSKFLPNKGLQLLNVEIGLIYTGKPLKKTLSKLRVFFRSDGLRLT